MFPSTFEYKNRFRKDEDLSFPVAIHDDMLDCISRIAEDDLKLQFPLEVENIFNSNTRKAKTHWDVI